MVLSARMVPKVCLEEKFEFDFIFRGVKEFYQKMEFLSGTFTVSL